MITPSKEVRHLLEVIRTVCAVIGACATVCTLIVVILTR